MSKTFTGVVLSSKTDKTIVVVTHTSKTHPIYRKRYMVSKHFMAHDEKNEANEGDRVLITETRPISALKRFKLVKVLEAAPIKHIEPEAKPEEVKKTEKEEAETKEQAS